MSSTIERIKLKAQASLGNAEALYLLGADYLYGIGVEPDLNLAHEYLSKAAEKGFDHAKQLLEYAFADNGNSTELSEELKEVYETVCTISQAADKGDSLALWMKNLDKLSDDTDDYMFNRGVAQMKQAADQNYAPALFALGIVYLKGNRIKGKKEEGLRMLINAAEQEYIPAVKDYADLFPEKAYPIITRLAKKEDADPEVFGILSQYYLDGIVVEKDEKQGVNLLKKAFEKGDKRAAFNLGIIHEEGLCGEIKSIEKAVSYYEAGVKKDDANCMLNLGHILEHSNEYPRDYQRAFDLYKRSADLGNGRGYNNLGTCYKRGIGTETDPKKALECYEQALALGYKDYSVYWNLYLYYMDGICLPRDFKKAVEWLQKGDEDGVIQCTYQLSRHIKNGDGIDFDVNKYFIYLKKAADGGYKDAYKDLADCYKYGVGVKSDEKAAFELYKKASHIDIEALHSLAECYNYGIGTKRDLQEAFNLYKKAAEQGHAQSQFDLGICYRHGEGTEQDFEKAIEWYLKAIEQGHISAMSNLGSLYYNGIGVERDLEKAYKYFTMAAEGGEKNGQFLLAHMYFNGAGVEQNYKEAVRWFTTAANQGEPDSMFHLAICYNEGNGVEKDPALAKEYLFKAAEKGWKPAVDVIEANNLDKSNTDTCIIDFSARPIPKVKSDKTPADVILSESGKRFPVAGGWGYSADTAVEILLNNSGEGIDLENWFIKFRAYKELNGLENRSGRFGAIRCLNVEQSLQTVNGKSYDVLKYIVTALPIEDKEIFDKEWKEHDGFQNEPEGLKKFQERVDSKVVGYETCCWFDISKFYKQ